MNRLLCILSLGFTWITPALAQGPSIDPPVADSKVDFSNIVGKYTIKVSAAPTDVHLEEAITLRIEIVGEGPEKYEPNRKDLKLFPASWVKDFYIEEQRDEHKVERDKKTWLFVYRLKPKHLKVESIDGIKFVYYDHATRQFATKYPKAIPLKVKPKPEDPGPETPIAVPDSFYDFAASENVLRSSGSVALGDEQLALLLVLPPLVCLAFAIAWRRLIPDESHRTLQLRASSAARALADLQKPGASVRDILARYLRERFDLDVAAPTPAEVFAFLKRRGFAISRCKESQAFFQADDADRYTIEPPPGTRPLAKDAARVIQALEADPCARG